MANVSGVVEAISTKYGKFSILIDGKWYATKQEWAPSNLPDKGDSVSFDDGGKNYLKGLKVVGSSGGGTASAPVGRRNNNLGVELGHAANLAMQVTLATEKAAGSVEFYKFFAEQTETVYKIMRGLRTKHEEGDAKAAENAAAVAKVEEKLIKPVTDSAPTSDDSDLF